MFQLPTHRFRLSMRIHTSMDLMNVYVKFTVCISLSAAWHAHHTVFASYTCTTECLHLFTNEQKQKPTEQHTIVFQSMGSPKTLSTCVYNVAIANPMKCSFANIFVAHHNTSVH